MPPPNLPLAWAITFIFHRALAGGVAGGRTTEGVIAVLAVGYQSGAAMVCCAREQVALNLVALREVHIIRHRELFQQVCACHVLIAELLFRTTVNESRTIDATICAVAGGDGMLHRTVLGIGKARGAAFIIAGFLDDVEKLYLAVLC